MAGVLWIVAAVMELCSIASYYVSGFGVAFVLTQVFVLVTFGLTWYALSVKR
jgi:hypothetical protein